MPEFLNGIGAKPGHTKPNFKRAPGKGCKLGPAGVLIAVFIAIDSEVPDPVFPDENGNCPTGTVPETRRFLWFEWIECVPGV